MRHKSIEYFMERHNEVKEWDNCYLVVMENIPILWNPEKNILSLAICFFNVTAFLFPSIMLRFVIRETLDCIPGNW